MKEIKKIKRIRKIRGFSQTYMAQNLGISQRAYSKIELNETQLNWKKLTQIAHILKLGVWELVDTRSEFNTEENIAELNVGLLQQLINKYESKIESLEIELAELKQNTA